MEGEESNAAEGMRKLEKSNVGEGLEGEESKVGKNLQGHRTCSLQSRRCNGEGPDAPE